MSDLAALLALPVGAIFVWSGVAKAAADPAGLEGLALPNLTGRKGSGALLLRVAGLLELCVGGAILLDPGSLWPRWAALAAALAGALFASVVLRTAPGSPCGCFGTASAGVISPRTVARALSLAAAAGASLTTSASWAGALAASPALGLVVVMIEAGCVYALFREELGSLGYWRWKRRSSSGQPGAEDCATALVPAEVTMKRLRASKAWSTLRPHLVREQPIEEWREGCWRFVCFPAAHAERDATAVFAVRLPPDPPACKGAIVIDGSEEIVMRAGPPQRAGRVRTVTPSLARGGTELLAGTVQGGGR